MALGYTRGHFSALVAMEVDTDKTNDIGAHAHVESNDNVHVTYLPLVDHEGRLLPVHFLSASQVCIYRYCSTTGILESCAITTKLLIMHINCLQIGSEEHLLRDWLDCCSTDNGILVAQQRLTPRPALVNQMIDDWIDRYRKQMK